MCSIEDNNDWEINSDGLYIATRGFLTRRGYCCANRCRNCPYINWRDCSEWQPIAIEDVRRTRVSAKAVAGAQALLHHHEHQLRKCKQCEREQHIAMIEHYKMLLKFWGNTR